MPRGFCHLLNYKPLKGRQCRPFLLDDTVINWKTKGKRHGPVAEAFRRYIMAHKTEIAEQHFNWLQ